MADVTLMNNPMTTAEDIIKGGASGAPARLAVGSNGNVLTVTAGAVGWAAPAGGGTTIVGRAGYAGPPGVNSTTDFGSSTFTMNAVSAGTAGAIGVQIVVPCPLYLDHYDIWQTSTSLARSAEARLYKDNGDTTIDFVTGTDATWSFTPGAAGRQSSGAVSGAPVTLDPGGYWVFIRNTHASQTLVLGGAPAPTALLPTSTTVTSASGIAALGSTVDPTSTFAKGNRIWGIILVGRIMGQGSAW